MIKLGEVLMLKKNILLALVVGFVFCFVGAITANAEDLGLKIGGKEIGMDIYGKMHASAELLDDGDDESGYISSNASRLGFKGGAEVADGLDVIWQVESGVNLDEAGSTFATRNSYLGLASEAVGTLKLGRHDTPVKLIGREIDLFDDQIGDNRNVIGIGNNGFDLRANNLALYSTPELGGFEVMAGYVTEDGQDDTDAVTVSAGYGTEELYIAGGFEQHSEAWNTGGEEEQIFRVGIKYETDIITVAGLYETIMDHDGIDDADRDAFGGGIGWTPGGCDTTLKAQYYWTDGPEGTDEIASYMMAVGVDYALADSTTVYVAFAYTDNEDNASLGVTGGEHGDTVATVTGENPYGVALGIIYVF
jgi:predicted porin